MKQKYVLGFVHCGSKILLQKKARPVWQKGRYNGIGGKVERGEAPWQAMIREAKEELCGVTFNWMLFAVLKSAEFEVHVYCAEVADIDFDTIHSRIEDEPVLRFSIDDMDDVDVVYHVPLLLKLLQERMTFELVTITC